MRLTSRHYIFAALLFAVALAAEPALAQVVQAEGDECAADTLGGMICNFLNNTSGAPGFFAGFSYMAGLICGFLFIIKLREHVENPNSIPIWDPLKRAVAAGAFFATPMVVNAVKSLISTPDLYTNGGTFNGESSGVGLDAMIVRLMSNTLEPMVWATGWIGWLGGLIFVFIGISRLLKTEQEGPRGPTGIGTVTTFIIAGALFSLNSLVVFFNTTIFGDAHLDTNGALQYTQGLTDGAQDHVHAVISAIIGFSVIIGWISLVRGLFIVRGVSEGNSQASMMAALTHLIGGALAINLGGVIMAVQNTLGITPYGIVFN